MINNKFSHFGFYLLIFLWVIFFFGEHNDLNLFAQVNTDDQQITVRHIIGLYGIENYKDARDKAISLWKSQKFRMLSSREKVELFLFLGASQLKLGDQKDAENAIRRLFDIEPNFNFEEYRPFFESGEFFPLWIRDFEKSLFGDVRIKTSPEEGADVFIDDNNYSEGKTNIIVRRLLVDKVHKVNVKKDGYKPEERSFTVKPDSIVDLVLELNVIPKEGSISVHSIPEGAEVYINEENNSRGKTPVQIDHLSANKLAAVHLIYKNVKKSINPKIVADSTLEITIPFTGSLYVTSDPVDANVYLNEIKKENLLGTTPLEKTGMLPKNQTIYIQKDGFKSQKHEIELQTDSIVRINAELKKPFPWKYVVGGAILAGGGVYAVTEILNKDEEPADQKLPGPPDPPGSN